MTSLRIIQRDFLCSELKEKRDELVRKKSEQQVQGGQVQTA